MGWRILPLGDSRSSACQKKREFHARLEEHLKLIREVTGVALEGSDVVLTSVKHGCKLNAIGKFVTASKRFSAVRNR